MCSSEIRDSRRRSWSWRSDAASSRHRRPRERVEVSLPSLRDAELGSEGRIVGLTGGALRVHNPFISKVTLEGTLDELELRAGDDVGAKGLTVRAAHLQLESHANVTLTVTEELVAHGRRRLHYIGSPKVVEIGPKVDVTRR